jgi:hypothetical protein
MGKKKKDGILDVRKDLGTADDQHLLRRKLNLEEQLQAKALEIKDLKKDVEFYKDEKRAVEETLERVLGMKDASSSAKPREIKSPASRKSSKTTVVVQASDWHFEENVDPATVSGMNHYNVEIAGKRMDTFWAKTLTLLNAHREHSDIDTLILHLGGDFMSGHIHDDLIEATELSPNQAIYFLIKRLQEDIKAFHKAAGLKRLIIICSDGNHGRSTKDRRVATRMNHSWEWLLYKVMELQLSDIKGIEFHVAEGYHTYLKCYDFDPLRFHHGDAIRYGGGVGGITIPVKKAIAEWNKSIRAYYDFFGHYHQCVDVGNFVCNGSMIGYNAFAVQIKAPYEPPTQSFTLINNKRGNEGTLKIHLDSQPAGLLL